MKKKYAKPQIAFESFELSQSIAAGCEMIQQNMTERSCPVTVPELIGTTYFADLNHCTVTPPGGNDSICYHVPSENNNVYSS